MRNRTRLARLRHWVKVLEKVEKDKRKFNMAAWAIAPAGGKIGDCGTAACAFGWAGLDPEFRAAGLKTRRVSPYSSEGYVTYGHDESGHAASLFFGITESEALQIVAVSRYRAVNVSRIKPRTVIARIEKLIKKYDGASA